MTRHPPCPYCRSSNTLPFEEDSDPFPATLPVIFLAALAIIGLYLVLLMLFHIHYPLIVLVFVAIAGSVIGRQEKKKKRRIRTEQFYICLDCDRDFRSES